METAGVAGVDVMEGEMREDVLDETDVPVRGQSVDLCVGLWSQNG
jgi:hypothetical protein